MAHDLRFNQNLIKREILKLFLLIVCICFFHLSTFQSLKIPFNEDVTKHFVTTDWNDSRLHITVMPSALLNLREGNRLYFITGSVEVLYALPLSTYFGCLSNIALKVDRLSQKRILTLRKYTFSLTFKRKHVNHDDLMQSNGHLLPLGYSLPPSAT